MRHAVGARDLARGVEVPTDDRSNFDAAAVRVDGLDGVEVLDAERTGSCKDDLDAATP